MYPANKKVIGRIKKSESDSACARVVCLALGGCAPCVLVTPESLRPYATPHVSRATCTVDARVAQPRAIARHSRLQLRLRIISDAVMQARML